MLRVVHEQQVGKIARCRAIECAAQGAKIGVAEDIAVDHEEGCFPEQGQRLPYSARGLERLRLSRIADRYPETAAIAQRLFDHPSEVCVVDDQLAEARRTQSFYMPHDERLSTGFEQRLGAVVGERAHAFAPSGGQDHRLHVVAQKVYPTVRSTGSIWFSSFASGASST